MSTLSVAAFTLWSSSISARPESKVCQQLRRSQLEAERETVDVLWPPGCSKRLSYVILQWIFFFSSCFAFSQHWDAARIARLETPSTNYLSMAQPPLKKSAWMLWSCASLPLRPTLACSFLHATFLRSLWWHSKSTIGLDWKLIALCAHCAAASCAGNARQTAAAGIPSVMWAESTEHSWCGRPLNLWIKWHSILLQVLFNTCFHMPSVLWLAWNMYHLWARWKQRRINGCWMERGMTVRFCRHGLRETVEQEKHRQPAADWKWELS